MKIIQQGRGFAAPFALWRGFVGTKTLAQPSVENDAETGSKTDYVKRSKIIYHNDDVTTFDFVALSLIRFFGKSLEEASELTLKVHNEGLAIVAVLPREAAELKRDQVVSAARAQKFPLCVELESE